MKTYIVLFILIFFVILSSCNETTQGVVDSPGDKNVSIKILGVDDPLPTDLPISLFPNPNSIELILTYSIAEATQVNIRVQSIVGDDVMIVQDSYEASGEHEINLSVEHLPSAVYIVRCETGYGATGIALFEVIKH